MSNLQSEKFTCVSQVAYLPDKWDQVVGDNHFLERKSLERLERLNPCNQRYHYHEQKEIILVTYTLKLDLFSFLPFLTFKVPVTIVGLPLSASKAGYVVKNSEDFSVLAKYVRTLRGLTILLNSDDVLPLPQGNTLSSYCIKLIWNGTNAYVASLRSHYRNSLSKAIKRLGKIDTVELESNEQFTSEMYELYLKVFNNSNNKLEKQSIAFFREYPSKILSFLSKGDCVGFVQLVSGNKKELVFLFGGFDPYSSFSSSLYKYMLYSIINYGLTKGFTSIDLGQTAEESKSKAGAIPVNKWMYVNHSNPVIRFFIERSISLFSYRRYPTMHKVFKNA